MPRLTDVLESPRGPQRLYVNPPEEAVDRVESVHTDDEGRFLGYVNEAQRVVRIMPDETPNTVYATDDALATEFMFRTEEAIQLRMTLPVYPPTGMYFTGGPMVIEGTATMAQTDLYTMTMTGTSRVDVIWTQWTTNAGTAAIGTNNVWTTWQNNTASSNTVYPQRYAQPAPLTAEQIAEQEARFAKLERRRKREVRQRQIAELRAQRLLHELLTDEQAKEYAERKSFHVRVRDRTFRINRGLAGNITEIDEAGNQLAKYCVHLYGQEPTEDSMVAQLLMLQTDLAEFERRANVTRYQPRVSAAA
jgi:predicted protein tyrosine phosphatase